MQSKDWDDIITVHTDETFCQTWTMQVKRLCKHSLGLTTDLKAKGQEHSIVGAAKVCIQCCLYERLFSAYFLYIVYMHAATSFEQVPQQGKYIC